MPLEWPGVRRARAQQHYVRALQYYQAGERLMAIADLGEAIKANRRRAAFYSARALIWAEEEEYEYAESDCDLALARDPNDLIAYYVLGMVAFEGGRYADAIDHFTRAVQCDTARIECRYFRAVCYYEDGQPDHAAADMAFVYQNLPPEDARRLDAARWLNVFQGRRKKPMQIRRR